jgi:predicted TIM-barrel fold metal-dependent hydrolase
VLYPNIAGFGGQRFLKLKDPELMLVCVRAYNDFLIEWADEGPGRFIPIAALPFWDVELAVLEAKRAVEAGHKGVLFSGAPYELDFPVLADRHWDPLWNTLQDLDVSVSIHLGSDDIRKSMERGGGAESRANAGCRVPTDLFLNIGRQLNDLLFSGVLPRFPGLKFVMVESGIGYIPFVLDSADYHFRKSALREEWPCTRYCRASTSAGSARRPSGSRTSRRS